MFDTMSISTNILGILNSQSNSNCFFFPVISPNGVLRTSTRDTIGTCLTCKGKTMCGTLAVGCPGTQSSLAWSTTTFCSGRQELPLPLNQQDDDSADKLFIQLLHKELVFLSNIHCYNKRLSNFI